MKLFIFFSVVAFALGTLSVEKKKEWDDFKMKYGKAYEEQEEKMRFEMYSKNKQMIDRHNREFSLGIHSFDLAVNEFADMTVSELSDHRSCLKSRPDNYGENEEAATFLPPSNVEIPDSVDWRTKGYVTPIKNQGRCGSCWAFSTTGSLEGQTFKKTGKLVSLSEQNLVDCSRPEGNQGCQGGLMDDAFKYIKINKGIDTEESYPYLGVNGQCHFSNKTIGGEDTGYVDIQSKNETALKIASATVGPISVAIDANMFFQFYHSGVFDPWYCSQTKLDHGVLVVGYGTDNGNDYWIVKNSWGTGWGQDGYIWMIRNKDNKCGIATQASYPTV